MPFRLEILRRAPEGSVGLAAGWTPLPRRLADEAAERRRRHLASSRPKSASTLSELELAQVGVILKLAPVLGRNESMLLGHTCKACQFMKFGKFVEISEISGNFFEILGNSGNISENSRKFQNTRQHLEMSGQILGKFRKQFE